MKYLIVYMCIMLVGCKSLQVANEVNNPISNNVFVHYVGSMHEDIVYTGNNPREREKLQASYMPTKIYLILKFDNEKVTAIERYISNYEIPGYELNLSSNWKLINKTEIKIYFKPAQSLDLNVSLFRGLQFKYENEKIIGSGKDWSGKDIRYVFINSAKLDKKIRRNLKLRKL